MAIDVPKFYTLFVLLLALTALNGCRATHDWLESIMRPDMEMVDVRHDTSMQATSTQDTYSPGGADFERLRNAALGYYGNISAAPYTPVYNTPSMASSLDPSVDIFQVDGSYAPGATLTPSQFANAQSGYQYQSMFPELGGVNPFGTQGANIAAGGSGRSGTALPPVYGGPDGQSMIFFAHGSSRIGSGDDNVLRQVAQDAQSSQSPLRIDAYASQRTEVSDPVRAAEINLKQSLDRAYAVSQSLIQKGVPLDRIQTSTWGDTRLSAQGEAYDRRVEITPNSIVGSTAGSGQ